MARSPAGGAEPGDPGSGPQLVAVQLPPQQAITVHGVLVVLGFVLPSAIFLKLLQRQRY